MARWREMDEERNKGTERNSPAAAFNEPTGHSPVAAVYWKKKPSSANHLPMRPLGPVFSTCHPSRQCDKLK